MYNKNSGFTLIEVLVSIVLISILVVFVFPAFSNIFNSIFSSGQKTSSTYTAQKNLIENFAVDEENSVANNTISYGDIEVTAEIYEQTEDYNNPVNSSTKEVILHYYKYLNTVSP